MNKLLFAALCLVAAEAPLYGEKLQPTTIPGIEYYDKDGESNYFLQLPSGPAKILEVDHKSGAYDNTHFLPQGTATKYLRLRDQFFKSVFSEDENEIILNQSALDKLTYDRLKGGQFRPVELLRPEPSAPPVFTQLPKEPNPMGPPVDEPPIPDPSLDAPPEDPVDNPPRKPVGQATKVFFDLKHGPVPESKESANALREQALIQAINSVSWSKLPLTLSKKPGSTLQVELKDYLHEPTVQTILKENPYACGEKSLIRPDWFISRIFYDNKTYQSLLEFPDEDASLRDFYAKQIGSARTSKDRIGVPEGESEITHANRVLQREEIAKDGKTYSLFTSFDFLNPKTNPRRKETEDIFLHPDNFTQAGHEGYGTLPNGYRFYYISNSAGNFIDEAPLSIVHAQVSNPVSCFQCHSQGTRGGHGTDWLTQTRKLASVGATEDTKDSLTTAKRISNKEWLEKTAGDDKFYRNSLKSSSGSESLKPIVEFLKSSRKDVSIADLAQELEVSEELLLRVLQDNKAVRAKLLGANSLQGDYWKSQKISRPEIEAKTAGVSNWCSLKSILANLPQQKNAIRSTGTHTRQP